MKKTSRICAAALVFLLLLSLPAKPVYASGAIGDVSEFNSLSGTAKYVGDTYRDNYYLDMEETGLLDTGYSILNSIANVLFSFIRWLAYAAVCVFFICFNLNLSSMFGDQINGIQEALNNSVFKPLFLLACVVVFIVLLGRLVRQDLMGALGQLAKIIGVVMLSILVVTQSATVLTYTTGITKSVSVEIMAGVNSANGMASNITSFAAQSAGILWQNLIHEPWITMEFDKDKPSESEIEQFLTIPPSDKDARQRLVSDRDWACFSKNRGAEKLGFMFLYLIPFAMKAIIYILIALVQLVFQLMAIFYVLMAPLILIISMVPGYERMLGIWLRKILESQVSILIITMMIGILIKFDQLIYEWARANSFGWLLAMVLQVALAVALFLNRNKLLGIMSTVQRGVSTPRFAANRMRMGGNLYQNAMPQGIKFGKKAGNVAWNTLKKTAGSAWRSVSDLGEKRMDAYGNTHPVDEEGAEEAQRNRKERPRSSRAGSGGPGGPGGQGSPGGQGGPGGPGGPGSPGGQSGPGSQESQESPGGQGSPGSQGGQGGPRGQGGQGSQGSPGGQRSQGDRGSDAGGPAGAGAERGREHTKRPELDREEEGAAAGLNRENQRAAMARIEVPASYRPKGDAAPSGGRPDVRRPMPHSQAELLRQMETRLPERPADQETALKSGNHQSELMEKLQTEVQREVSKLRPKAETGVGSKRADGGREKQQILTVKVKVEEQAETGKKVASHSGKGEQLEQPVRRVTPAARLEQPVRRAAPAARLEQPVRRAATEVKSTKRA